MSSVFTNEFLDSLNMAADAPLDRLINEAAGPSGGVAKMTQLFRRVINSPRLRCDELERMRDEHLLTQEIVDFFVALDAVPKRPWIQPALLHAGGTFYRDRGVLGFVTLGCASLPACYCMADEAYQLGCTGRLQKPDEVPRRLPETAMFVLDVVTKDAFQKEGVGIHASHKVRLMHAIIRYFIISKQVAIADGHDSPVEREQVSEETHIIFGHNWTVDRGPPIAQEEMIATLLTFSYVVLDGFERMGMDITEAEKTAYLHRWNVVGYLLGVDDRVLASMNTMDDAKAMFDLIMERKRMASEDGKTLQIALLDYMQNNIIDRVMGGKRNPMIIIPRILTRQLSGAQTSKAVALKLGFFGHVLRYPVWWCVKIAGHLNNYRWVRKITYKLMVYLSATIWNWRTDGETMEQDALQAASQSRGQQAPAPARQRQQVVQVPESLAKTWNLKQDYNKESK